MQLELNLQHGENENSNNKSNKSKKIIVEKYYFKKPHRIFDAMLNKKNGTVISGRTPSQIWLLLEMVT